MIVVSTLCILKSSKQGPCSSKEAGQHSGARFLKILQSTAIPFINGDLKIQGRWRRPRKRHVKREFVFLQSWLRLFHLTAFTLSNVGKLSWSWIPKNHIQVEKGKQNFVVYMIIFSIKLDIRDFHIVVEQWRQRQRSVLHVHVVVLIIKPIAFFDILWALHFNSDSSFIFVCTVKTKSTRKLCNE